MLPRSVLSRLLPPVLAGIGLAAIGCGSITYRETAERARAAGLEPISFRFDHPSQLRSVAPGGATYARLEARSGSVVSERVVVTPLELGHQPGPPAAYLPVEMERVKNRAARLYRGFRFVQEGRAKVGEAYGYQLFFSASGSASEGRGNLVGRIVLLPEPGLAKGVMITVLAGPAAGLERATLVGNDGLAKQVLESFRFGSG